MAKLRSFTTPESKLFLKSEYGPLSSGWPVVAFTATALKNKLEREYRTGRDFIIYTGTSGAETIEEGDRARLLSVVGINATKSYRTADVIPKESWEWAAANYPGQWENAFEAIRGWDIPSRPRSSDVVGDSYTKMGRYPYRGMILELEGKHRDAVLDLELVPIDGLGIRNSDSSMRPEELLRPENELINQDATRLAALVFSRVQLSGQVIQSTAPIRDAPVDLLLQITKLLKQTPLTCALCGGVCHSNQRTSCCKLPAIERTAAKATMDLRTTSLCISPAISVRTVPPRMSSRSGLMSCARR